MERVFDRLSSSQSRGMFVFPRQRNELLAVSYSSVLVANGGFFPGTFPRGTLILRNEFCPSRAVLGMEQQVHDGLYFSVSVLVSVFQSQVPVKRTQKWPWIWIEELPEQPSSWAGSVSGSEAWCLRLLVE